MKKLLFALSVLFAVNCMASNDSIYVDISGMTQIDLSIAINNNTNHPQYPKAPVNPPLVFIYGHTLVFDGYYIDTISLEDEDGNEVYSMTIEDSATLLTLPEWLSGQYELHIHRGNFCFWGNITLN